MKRIGPSTHATRIASRSKARSAGPGRPNVLLQIPSGSELGLPEGRHAVFAVVSAPVLGSEFSRSVRLLRRLTAHGDCAGLVLDLRLVRGADACGLRELTLLAQALRHLPLGLRVRSSSALSVLIRLASLPAEGLTFL